MDLIATDTLNEICLFLEPEDLISFFAVCKRTRALRKNHRLIIRCFYNRINYLYKEPVTVPSRMDTNYTKAIVLLGGIYPGIEEHLDYFHCLGRSVMRNNSLAVAYFSHKGAHQIDLNEYLTLFKIINLRFHLETFRALLRGFFLNHRQYYFKEFFTDLPKEHFDQAFIGFPKLTLGGRGFKLDQPATYLTVPSDGDNQLQAECGYIFALRDKYYNDFPDDVRKRCSRQINNLIESLPKQSINLFA